MKFIILILLLSCLSFSDAVQSRVLARFDGYTTVYSIQYKGTEYLIVKSGSADGGIAIIPVVTPQKDTVFVFKPEKEIKK